MRPVAFSKKDFADRTDFERFVLTELGVHRIRIDDPSVIHDLRSGGGIVARAKGVSMSRAKQKLAARVRPLSFAAAYKVLDLLVEEVLRANKLLSTHLGFKQKIRKVQIRPAALPHPLAMRPALWDRLAKLFDAFLEARNAVTHRRSDRTPNGGLDVYDNGGTKLDTIGADELAHFVTAVHATAEAVIVAQTDERELDVLAWHLNQLAHRHNLPALQAPDPSIGRRILIADLVDCPEGARAFDVVAVLKTIRGQPPSRWDLELHDDRGRVFVGRWEDVPVVLVGRVPINASGLPDWLDEVT